MILNLIPYIKKAKKYNKQRFKYYFIEKKYLHYSAVSHHQSSGRNWVNSVQLILLYFALMLTLGLDNSREKAIQL